MSVKLRKKKISKGRFSLYLDIYHNGERSYDFLELYLEKSKPDESKENLAAAKKIRLAVEHQLAFSKRNVPNEGKLDTCLLKYIEVKYKGKKKDRFNAIIEHLKTFAGSVTIPFRIITKQWLLDFQEYLRSGEDRIENTVNSYMQLVNTVLNKAMRDDTIPFNPWKKVDTDEKAKMTIPKVDPLEPKDIRKMLLNSSGVPSQVRQCFTTAILSGMRWGDVSSLQKAAIKRIIVNGEKQKIIDFTQEKTDKEKYLPVSADMIRVLAERMRDERKEIHKRVANGQPYVICKEFFPRLIQREGETNKGYMYMRFHLLKWAKQAKIEKRINFHLSRHTFATLLLLEVKDLNMVRDMLGHSKIATTQRYAKVLDALKAESMNRMNKYRLLG